MTDLPAQMAQAYRYIARLRSMLPFRDPADVPVLVISGSGRSGTTWLAELVAEGLGARMIFEPFKPGVVGGLDRLNNRQYLRPGQPAPDFSPGIENILTGHLRHRWTDRYNNRFVYEARLIKEVRANLMLGWMLDASPDLRVLHVVRNPLATVASQRCGGWRLTIDKFTSQPDLVQDYLGPFTSLIADATVSPEREALMHWAIENYVPIEQARSGRWPDTRLAVFSYDTLRRDAQAMRAFLITAGVPEGRIGAERIARPSRVSRGRTDFTGTPPIAPQQDDALGFLREIVDAMRLKDWVEIP